MINSFFQHIIENPKRTLIALLITTIVFASFIPRLKIDFTIEHLFSESDPSIEEYTSFRQVFGREDNVITIIYKPDNIYDKSFYADLEEMIYNIEDLSGIQNIVSIFSLSDIDLNAWLGDLNDPELKWKEAEIREKLSYIRDDPSIGPRVLSKDLSHGSIIISIDNASNNHNSRTALLKDIKSLTAEINADWIYSGVSVLRTEYVGYMLRDNFLFLPPIALLLIGILSFIFRNWVYVFLPLLTVLITVIWILGFMGMTGLDINIMTYIVPTLLFIIGIGDAIHIQARFKENITQDPSDPKKAMLKTMNQMFRVIFLTSVTTSIGFLALMTTSIEIVKEFGLEISAGVMMAWLVSSLLVPSGIIYSKQFKTETRFPFRSFLIWLSNTIPSRPWAFIIVPSLVVAVSLFKIKDVSTNSSLMDDLRPQNKLYQDLKLTEKYFGGVLPFEILIKTVKNDNGINRSAIDMDVLNLSKDLENFLKIELPNSRFFSLNNLLESAKRIQKNNKEKLSDENLIKEIVNNQSMEDLKLVSEDRNILRLTGLIEDKTSDEMKVLYAKLDSIGSEFPQDVKLEYTGTTLVALKTNDYLVQALVNSLGLALFFISLIMAYLFRANSILFISLITNLVPIFTILGLLAWLGISIRPPTAMTFAVALGIAVDDSLHFLLRYKKELSKGLSRLEAIQSTIINTGSALMITTTVLVAGFSVLLFSAFLPTYQFGLLAAAMIGTALICDLTLLPALCLVLPNARNKSK
ncbi:RND transporter [bacterium]|nr:MAG: RND transporter [bacterium]